MNDGKYLEEEVEKHLKKIRRTNFHWRRLTDSYAARGRVTAKPADYFICNDGRCCHLEVKSQKGKTIRLNKFDQLPRMKRWKMAGVEGWVLVHFWELDKLCLVHVDTLNAKQPSWLLCDADEIATVERAIEWIGGK